MLGRKDMFLVKFVRHRKEKEFMGLTVHLNRITGGIMMLKKIKDSLIGLGVIILGFAILGFFITSSISMPDEAHVLVDDNKKVYYAPPYIEFLQSKQISSIDVTALRKTTAGEARAMKYKPDPECRDNGYFLQEGRNLTLQFFEKVGILKPLPHRWNRDGSWNW